MSKHEHRLAKCCTQSLQWHCTLEFSDESNPASELHVMMLVTCPIWHMISIAAGKVVARLRSSHRLKMMLHTLLLLTAPPTEWASVTSTTSTSLARSHLASSVVALVCSGLATHECIYDRLGQRLMPQDDSLSAMKQMSSAHRGRLELKRIYHMLM